jgi:hypothetical protein
MVERLSACQVERVLTGSKRHGCSLSAGVRQIFAGQQMSVTHSNEVWNIFKIAEEQDYEKHSEKGTMQKLQNDVGIL